MEDPQVPMGTMVNILCCMCGVSIAPNPSNTCASCLAGRADVSRGISTEATLHQCRGCQRWHKDAGKWVACELESRELMALCLANVSGLKKTKNSGEKVRLVDAKWIWTEPHSMRLKVQLTVQKEVQTGTILQQSFVVVFVVRNQQCIECQAEFRQGSWRALVQVRQRVGHKRTFLYLEQLILKHGAHRGCLSIETFRDGMDFYFPDKGKAARFISFLENVVPIKVRVSMLVVDYARYSIVFFVILVILNINPTTVYIDRSRLPKSSWVQTIRATFPISSIPTWWRFVHSVRMIYCIFHRNWHGSLETFLDWF